MRLDHFLIGLQILAAHYDRCDTNNVTVVASDHVLVHDLDYPLSVAEIALLRELDWLPSDPNDPVNTSWRYET